jgi:UDP-glucose 4-epimerase
MTAPMREFSALKSARVMVTGGFGLIGSTLARRLVDVGADVLLVDSLKEDFGGNVFNIHDIRNAAKTNISDIRDTHGLRYLLRDCDFIFNLAGQTSHLDSMTAPFEDLEINCTAQLSLMEACRFINPTVRVVYASTRQIYGRPQYLPVDEKHPLSPVDVNGINKIAGESYHRLYFDAYGIATTVLRLTNTYGPHMRIRDARQIFLGLWIRRLLERKPFEVWGGQQLRDFTYVDDAAAAFLLAALTPETKGKVFNIGGSEVVKLMKVAEMLIEINGEGVFEVKEFPYDRKVIDIGDYHTDDRAFRSATGWFPQVPMTDGLRRTLDFYRVNLYHYV